MLLIKTTARFHDSKWLSLYMYFAGLSIGMIGPNFSPALLTPCIGILFYLPETTYYLKNGEFSTPGLNHLFYKTKCFPKLLVVKFIMGIMAGATINYFMYINNKSAAENGLIVFSLTFSLLMFFTRKCIR